MATSARSKATFNWEDPLLLESQLNEDERMVRDAARQYCQDKLAPRILEAFRSESTDPKIFREMGEIGLLGPTIPEEFGGPALNYVSYGLIAREVERVDSGYRSMMSVQSSLVMVPIFEFGTQAQKEKYLPKLATGEWIGCFGLTEPNHGSDPGSMASRAKAVPGGYQLTGSKTWSMTTSPVIDARRPTLPAIFGADRPFIPLSRMKPLMRPSKSPPWHFAQTTKTSAIGEFEIQVFDPVSW